MIKKNYRNRHFLIIGGVFYIILGQIVEYVFPVHTKLLNVILMIIWCLLISRCSGNIEKGDELTKENIRKATSITFWIISIFIMVCAIVGQNINSQTVLRIFASDVYFYTFFCAIGLRSVIFLVLDATPLHKSED